jgi:hypothetical protein
MYLDQYILLLITITDNRLIYVYNDVNEVKEIREVHDHIPNTQTPCHARHAEKLKRQTPK